MSRISDVSSRLGEYMLLGWVLTDEACAVCSVPMLRSPVRQTPERMFCAQCQSTPDAPAPPAATHVPPPPSTASFSGTEVSRISTPPTEVSSALSSPTFALPPDPQETMRRRAQSDLASAELGKRMLRGWAMLAEECPNNSCYGVPLARPPKADGGKDPRKECVICGNVYVFGRDAQGLNQLVPLESAGTSAGQPFDTSDTLAPLANVSTVLPTSTQNLSGRKPVSPSDGFENAAPQKLSASGTLSILDDSIQSLERCIQALANRLTSLSSQVPVNHVMIGEVAMSMERATNALRTLKHLHYQETSSCT